MRRITKQGLRGFAAGVLFSTAVLSFVYYSEQPEKVAEAETVQKSNPVSEPNKETLLPAPPTDTKGVQQPQQASSVQPKKKVYTYRLTIGKGMSPEEAAARLEEAHIISDDKQLIKYLNDFSLMGSVRFGNFDLNSNMKIQEIAKIITTAKAN